MFHAELLIAMAKMIKGIHSEMFWAFVSFFLRKFK
jgi:hypothetical protein